MSLSWKFNSAINTLATRVLLLEFKIAKCLPALPVNDTKKTIMPICNL